ncbi:MAG: branched-chain amino acid ABC transporter permease [Desulfobacteraceae bacterium]|jgi:branched-chain amino acid transport system permease protein|nr:branched-chain amino acid ABC transporter permease [Desulfobacteraceae bacterium]
MMAIEVKNPALWSGFFRALPEKILSPKDKINLPPELLAQVALNALMLSSMYILMALGFAILLSVMRVLNFAHAVIYMGGGYICYQLAIVYGLNQWLSLMLAAIIMGLFGLFLERFCFRPFFGDVNRTLVMTLALIVIIESMVNILVGTQIRSLPAFASGIIRTGGVSLSVERLVTFIISAALLLVIIFFIQKTKIGQQMLAVSQDDTGAVLQGINIYRVSAVATVIACALAAVAGSLMGAIFSLSPYMGGHMLVKAIEIVILAGIGSIGGVLVAGLILGTIDATLPILMSGSASDVVGLGIVILILLFRPQGLFGHEA